MYTFLSSKLPREQSRKFPRRVVKQALRRTIKQISPGELSIKLPFERYMFYIYVSCLYVYVSCFHIYIYHSSIYVIFPDSASPDVIWTDVDDSLEGAVELEFPEAVVLFLSAESAPSVASSSSR